MCKGFKLFRGIVFLVFLFHFKMAFAASVFISGVPTAWRVESYSEKNVVVWGTPSKCSSGMVTLPSTATTAEYNRLYATIMAAKMAQSNVFFYYDDSTPNCTIISFGLTPAN